MIRVQREQLAPWIAPAFLTALVIAFILAPWSLKDKLDAVCFGI